MRPGHNAEVSAERARWYAPMALAQVPRLLSMLDREAASVSSGNFDRENWGWKFRDFPLGMLQTAVYPLALVWRHALAGNPYHRNARLLDWIVASIEHTLGRQHRNGAFDAFCPNEQEPGVTVGVMHGLAEAYRVLAPELPENLVRRLLESMRRAFAFALPRDESHAFISNHQALFAVGYLDAHELIGEPRCRERAERIVARILEHQSTEGWFLEYEGADPGYESLGIQHLAVYWQRTNSPAVLEALRRSVEFYAHCVHPDGSVGGCYGSRQTGLYFPAGFELISAEIPQAAAIAAHQRERMARHSMVTPESADSENLVPLLGSYLEACLAPGTGLTAQHPPLPCRAMTGTRRFQKSGLVFAAGSRYYGVMNLRRGGVCRIFDKQEEKLAYEDAGYVLAGRGVKWTSQALGMSRPEPAGEAARDATSALFTELRQELLSPWKFVLLRLLNLTLFRSLAAGAWLRRLIVRRLVLKKQPGPFRLRRSVQWGEKEIRFHDEIERLTGMRPESVALPRSLTSIHMGSAKYFHASELDDLPAPDLRPVAAALHRERTAKLEFSITFPAAGAPRLLQGELTAEHHAHSREAVVT